MNCEIQKTLKIDSDTYNVIRIEQGGTFDYYLQKVGYGDLMHIVGTFEPCELTTDYIVQSIAISININFWGD